MYEVMNPDERAISRRIAKVKPGDTFIKEKHSFKVDTVYTHHAKCIRDDGKIECFTVGDFVIMGKEDSEPNKENCYELE